jgi:hypothetical protein
MPRGIAVIAVLIVVAAAQARASGPIYVNRNAVPLPIAKLHTCVAPKARTTMLPRPLGAGRLSIFVIGCPLGAPGVTTFQTKAEPGAIDDGFASLAYYVATDARGRGAKRIVFPYPRPDGTVLKADAVPALLDPGWSTRADTSAMTGAAYLASRSNFPRGAFMLLGQFAPADRPQRERVIAIWLVERGAAARLIYWAETSEKLRGDSPAWIYPKYEVVVDERPES